MVRIGIIGTGSIAREHARAISLVPGASLVAASDVVPATLDDFCETFQVSRKYLDAADLLADPAVDLVAITTPPVAHEPLAVAALQNGKYVFCEKPLAASLASAGRIAEVSAIYPGRLAVSYQLRYTAEWRRLIWICKNGWIGDIRSASIERHSFIPHSDHGIGGWWGSWEVAGGGVLMTQLIHEMDLLQLVMGRPVAVSAEMDTRYTGIESEDYVEATLAFEGGGTARCVASVNSGHLGGHLAIEGSSGTVALPWNLTMNDPRRLSEALRQLNGVNHRPKLTPHAYLYEEIVQSIRSGAPLPIPPADALTSLEICAAAYESALTGQEVRLPVGSSGTVFAGVSKAAYDARERSAKRQYFGLRNMTADGRLLGRPYREEQLTRREKLQKALRAIAVGTLRRVLGFVKVEPAMIRSLIQKRVTVHGGPRVRTQPWPRRRHFDRRERRAVMQIMDREILSGNAVVYGGVEEEAYCEAFAQYLGGGYADAVNSGTNAIYVALKALDLEPGSEVIVPPVSDAGGTMPVALNLCIPVPADSDPGSILTSAEQIKVVLTDRTSAIVVTHLAGHPVNMDPILELAAAHGIPVIEDCAQAHGAVYKGRMVGSLGTVSAFSTMFGKHHATGAQGGVVFTKDLGLFSRVKQVADRGKSYDSLGHQANAVASLNFNQDEISMAIGRVQLAKLPGAIDTRRAFASLVGAGLQGNDGVSLIGDPPGCASSYYFLMIRLDPAKVRSDSEAFAAALLSEGVDGVSAGYSVYPTDQLWHRDGAVFGSSGLPWSILQRPTSSHFPLPNAHQANRSIVRVDVHEFLGAREARDLVAAITKIARYYKRA
jgi:dTDP-4-amino-4,6-dideoxygalactose transaminase/predicted dehydrogenase